MNVPEGSVFDAESRGGRYIGRWTSMLGTFEIEVPEECCAEHGAEPGAADAFWDDRYAAEFAQDKKGKLPFMLVVHAISETEEKLRKCKSGDGVHQNAIKRYTRWLDALRLYRQKHYPNTEV